jgi:hypothetical protein
MKIGLWVAEIESVQSWHFKAWAKAHYETWVLYRTHVIIKLKIFEIFNVLNLSRLCNVLTGTGLTL